MSILERIQAECRCGACRGRIGRVNLVMLDRRARWEYPVAGNVLTGEEGWAVAVLCDACIEVGETIVEAVQWTDAGPVYHDVESLTLARASS